MDTFIEVRERGALRRREPLYHHKEKRQDLLQLKGGVQGAIQIFPR